MCIHVQRSHLKVSLAWSFPSPLIGRLCSHVAVALAWLLHCLAEVATDLESIPARFCVCFWSRSPTFVKKTDPDPGSVLFLAVTGVCMVFVNVIASVQNKHCWTALASMVAGDWTGVGFSIIQNFEPQVRFKNFGTGAEPESENVIPATSSAQLATQLSLQLFCQVCCVISWIACYVTSWITIDQTDSKVWCLICS